MYIENFLHSIMNNNCWQLHSYHSADDKIYVEYRASFLGRYYRSEIAVLVAENDEGLWECSHYGVVRIEAYYCPKPPYEWYELQDAQLAIELAEDNLIRIGMPFDPDFEFHGKNKVNKKRRNDALRRKYGLEAKEKKRLAELEKEDDE